MRRRPVLRAVAVSLMLMSTGWMSIVRLPAATGAPADTARDGIITGVTANQLSVAFAAGLAGATPVTVTAETRIVLRSKTALDAIKPGDLLAVTSRRGADGTLSAISIRIFPPEYKGRVTEREFVMESGNTMTNATVVQFADRVEGRTLFLKYKEGASAIAVPPGTEVQRLAVGRLGALHNGMHVVVRGAANADGSIAASSIIADEP